MLLSIALWYMGYNAVTTWFSAYIARVMGQNLSGAARWLLVASAGAIVSYIPIGMLSSRIGRKKTVLCGAALLALCFFSGYLLTADAGAVSPVMYICFALVGLAWAAINVNSLPMVVEMCRGPDVGRFTGYYYSFSMGAQVLTPVLSGWLLGHVSYTCLFPYAALFAGMGFVTMCFVKHGDAKAERKKGA